MWFNSNVQWLLRLVVVSSILVFVFHFFFKKLIISEGHPWVNVKMFNPNWSWQLWFRDLEKRKCTGSLNRQRVCSANLYPRCRMSSTSQSSFINPLCQVCYSYASGINSQLSEWSPPIPLLYEYLFLILHLCLLFGMALKGLLPMSSMTNSVQSHLSFHISFWTQRNSRMV